MPNCKFCGAEIAENTRFCSNCGAKTEEPPIVEAVTADAHNQSSSSTQQSPPPYTKRPIKSGLLIWSILNSSLGLLCCCSCLPVVSLILGVISITLLILAQDAKSDEAEKTKVRAAIILNIIASALIIVSVIFIICFAFTVPYIPYKTFNIDDFLRMYPSLD